MNLFTLFNGTRADQITFLSYANGLKCFGYRQSPLEAMAYDAEISVCELYAIFNAEKMVIEKLGL